jgi:hypothetical protein
LKTICPALSGVIPYGNSPAFPRPLQQCNCKLIGSYPDYMGQRGALYCSRYLFNGPSGCYRQYSVTGQSNTIGSVSFKTSRANSGCSTSDSRWANSMLSALPPQKETGPTRCNRQHSVPPVGHQIVIGSISDHSQPGTRPNRASPFWSTRFGLNPMYVLNALPQLLVSAHC